jgi:hypothetical protein
MGIACRREPRLLRSRAGAAKPANGWFTEGFDSVFCSMASSLGKMPTTSVRVRKVR